MSIEVVNCAYCSLNGGGADNGLKHNVGKFAAPYGEFAHEQGGYMCHRHMTHATTCLRVNEKRKQRKHIDYLKCINKPMSAYMEKKLLKAAAVTKCTCSKPISSFWECSGAWRDTTPLHICKRFLGHVYREAGESLLDRDLLLDTSTLRNMYDALEPDLDGSRALTQEHLVKRVEESLVEPNKLKLDNGVKKWGSVEALIADVAKKILHCSKNGLTPLMTSVAYSASGHAIKQLLFIDTSSAQKTNLIGWNALHHLTPDTGRIAINAILETDRSLAAKMDSKGRLPLHHAAHEGNCTAIEILVNAYPAGVKVRNRQGLVPLEVAQHRNETGAVNMLSGAKIINGVVCIAEGTKFDDRCICRRYYRSPSQQVP